MYVINLEQYLAGSVRGSEEESRASHSALIILSTGTDNQEDSD